MAEPPKEHIQRIEETLTRTEALFTDYAYLDLESLYESFRSERTELLKVLNTFKLCGVLQSDKWKTWEGLESDAMELVRQTRRSILRANEQFRRRQAGRDEKLAGVGSPKWAYQILEVSADHSDEEIRNSYREKLKSNHPDKLASADLDEAFTRLAEERVRNIKEAWEILKKLRGL